MFHVVCLLAVLLLLFFVVFFLFLEWVGGCVLVAQSQWLYFEEKWFTKYK